LLQQLQHGLNGLDLMDRCIVQNHDQRFSHMLNQKPQEDDKQCRRHPDGRSLWRMVSDLTREVSRMLNRDLLYTSLRKKCKQVRHFLARTPLLTKKEKRALLGTRQGDKKSSDALRIAGNMAPPRPIV
jgi:hypothetical protein